MLVSNTWIMPLYYYLFAWEMDIQLCVCTLCRLLFKHQVAPRNCRCCKQIYHELRWVVTHLRKRDLITWCKGESLEPNDTSNKQQKMGFCFRAVASAWGTFQLGALLHFSVWNQNLMTCSEQSQEQHWKNNNVRWFGGGVRGREPGENPNALELFYIFLSFFLFPLKNEHYVSRVAQIWFI